MEDNLHRPAVLLNAAAPRFLAALGVEIGRRDDGVDVALAARGLDGPAELVEVDGETHPRVLRAHAHGQDIRVWEDPSAAAVVILGRGLALRAEVAVEVASSARKRSVSSRLAGRGLSAEIGSEVLFFAGEPAPE